jgi:RimJ/RimL family protein N-acetyltransferase
VPLYAGPPLVDGDVALRTPDVAALRSTGIARDVVTAVHHWLATAQERADVLYFAVHRGSALVGQILLHDWDGATGESLVAYHLFRPVHRGHGTGTRALALLQRYAAEQTGLRSLVVITSSDNTASRRVAEKRGFVHLGAPREDPDGVLLRWVAPREP